MIPDRYEHCNHCEAARKCKLQKNVGKFYQLFKVHKKSEPGSLPPGRPIISGSGSLTENISKFVEHHLKDLATTHPSYLQDTPDFLRYIEEINGLGPLPNGAILVTMDVSSLYTNIPQDEGLEIAEDELNTRTDQRVPSSFISRLLEICLKYNIFEFDKQMYLQKIGTAMGIKPAPAYANLFMAARDKENLETAESLFSLDGKSPVLAYKRFLDDIFKIWKGPVQGLYSFLEEINKLHPSIKFTMEHTSPFRCDIVDPHDCWCHQTSSIPFLDTSVSINKEGHIVCDLYRKPTDRCQYLLPSSCHPNHVCESIPFSLAFRIVRICSEADSRDKRFLELRDFLLSRGYRSRIIDAAIQKASLIPREEAIRKKTPEKKQEGPVFVMTYHPALPSISQMLAKHWRSMCKDPYLKKIFPKPPMVAYRRQPNLKDKLIRAKVPEVASRPTRILKGMRKCNKPCPVCPFIQEGKFVKSTKSDQIVEINASVTCQSKNVVYCATCQKCFLQYIGQTERSLQERIQEHLGYIRNEKLNQATGHHFNLDGHFIHDFRVTILEKVHKTDRATREIRESLHIQNFHSELDGINKSK